MEIMKQVGQLMLNTWQRLLQTNMVRTILRGLKILIPWVIGIIILGIFIANFTKTFLVLVIIAGILLIAYIIGM